MDSPGEMRIHDKVCREALRLITSSHAKQIIPYGALKKSACDAMGVSIDEFDNATDEKKGSRKTERVWARRMVSIYLQANTFNSLKKVGIMTGGRDHASAFHDRKKFYDLYETNAPFRECVRLFFAFLDLDFPPTIYSHSMIIKKKTDDRTNRD